MKKVGTAMYVHKSALHQLYEKLEKNIQEITRVQNLILRVDALGFDYTIVKYDKGNVSFIQSIDFDSANEPTVGDSLCFKTDDTYKIIKGSGKIYHHKYLFVDVNYTGFDVERARQRAQLWESIPDIKKHKSRIGNRKYWNELLRSYNIPL